MRKGWKAYWYHFEATFISFKWPWWLKEVPDDWVKADVTSISKQAGRTMMTCRSVRLPSVSQKIMEKDLVEAIFKHVKDKNMFGNRQHGFPKAKACLTDCLLRDYWLFVLGGESGICHLPWIKQGLWHSFLWQTYSLKVDTEWTTNWVKNFLEHQT